MLEDLEIKIKIRVELWELENQKRRWPRIQPWEMTMFQKQSHGEPGRDTEKGLETRSLVQGGTVQGGKQVQERISRRG